MNASSATQSAKSGWYLDDLRVGMKFQSGIFLIDQRQMIDFAKQFDPQPFHLDVELAKQSIFGDLVASGWFTASVSMRLLLEALPLANGTIGLGGESMEWPHPVKTGDQLHLDGEVMHIRPSRSRDDKAVVTVRFSTYNQFDNKVFSNIGKLLVFRR